MKCHNCGHLNSRVIESRDIEEGIGIRRRRECLKCQSRFTTYERIEVPNLTIVKKDGSREIFDRNKIAAGIYKACEKRPLPISIVEDIISQIERNLRSTGEPEISSREVGEMIMGKLINLDDVAYVRFASVYRSFKDVASFEKELTKLKDKTKIKSN